MKHMKIRILTALLALGCLAGIASAENDWKTIAELNGAGEAKEVKWEGKIWQWRLICTEEPLIINTVVVRMADGEKKTVTLGKAFKKDERHVMKMGEGGKKAHIVGFRISDDKKGKYKLQVK